MTGKTTDSNDTSKPRRSFFDLLDALLPQPQQPRRRRSSKDIQIKAQRRAERERAGRPLL